MQIESKVVLNLCLFFVWQETGKRETVKVLSWHNQFESPISLIQPQCMGLVRAVVWGVGTPAFLSNILQQNLLQLWEVAFFLMSSFAGSGWCYLFQEKTMQAYHGELGKYLKQTEKISKTDRHRQPNTFIYLFRLSPIYAYCIKNIHGL